MIRTPYLEAIDNFTVPFRADLSQSDLSVSLRAIYQSNRFNFSSPSWEGLSYAYFSDIYCDSLVSEKIKRFRTKFVFAHDLSGYNSHVLTDSVISLRLL